ncbi:GNAT family N-acetyltransferase [Halomonas sp. MCCC 1A17488]|uniref:GNAT family N-acetyltransferase n=1 Tax=Billgrantia sulfidoxydans TaxID=2733484 RepID=A0ABX7W7V8_9GAMM|nr:MULTISPECIES: GNAT family N-acetyltransferase [Halomonas]MCE8018243.1 GNAT family N-acetyltransferase [Halomonas sp. MCCC 1A17488]MCG3241576.1 GNAT family N-acetyltransferase [Halomonas sp. MCCC 1A17488]QPP48475.1 GNAT family N-acetyltransferase [Halomonas sp. SS10-MC5]QTP55787.1 GNAT family N-acetyltransferase [Halomonas sulfidoxydans]
MSVALRQAQPQDLGALYRLEQVAFSGDRFSRRQLWHLLNRAHAETLVADDGERLMGYGTLLFRRGSRRARLYSFCVHPEARGSGLGRQLLEALERVALGHDAEALGLEVRADNRVALGLYRRMGFRLERWLDDYYEDGCAGWQMSKPLGVST